MEIYPLVFGMTEVVTATYFVARLVIRGRAVLRVEGEDVTIEGVNPGGLAGIGADLHEAHTDFRNTLRTVLADVAHGVDFDDFKKEAESFFNDNQSPELVAEWEAARIARRQAQEGALGLHLEPSPQVCIKVERANGPSVVPEKPAKLAA